MLLAALPVGALLVRAFLETADTDCRTARAARTGRYGFFVVSRFTRGGQPDPSFGDRGLVATDFGGRRAQAATLAIQADDRIVAAGTIVEPSLRCFALARYHPDGRLDRSFGHWGIQTTHFSGGIASLNAIALQTDGKIIAAGWCLRNSRNYCALARYNRDGRLDASFGDGGRVLTGVREPGPIANDLALQSDGRIVVAGGLDGGFGLARYRSDGSLDRGFGEDGKIITRLSPVDSGSGKGSTACAVRIQSDDRIVVAGQVTVGSRKHWTALSSPHFCRRSPSESGPAGSGIEESS